jgi:DNA invertase Pin-like site-specific DNA recombinase
MTTKRFGYVRVSSKQQNEGRQIETMLQNDIEERDIFIDKQSGSTFDRPEYKSLKNILRKGDTVVFDSITRMGRNMDNTLKEYRYFVENGINLQFIKEPMLNTDANQDDVILKAIQQAVLAILAAFAQKEREEIKTRQSEGIALAQKKGVKFGRPVLELPHKWNSLYARWKSGEITAVEFMKQVDMKKATFYKKVKEYEVNQ